MKETLTEWVTFSIGHTMYHSENRVLGLVMILSDIESWNWSTFPSTCSLVIFNYRGGEIMGECEAGFFCLSRSDEATPSGVAPDPRSTCPSETCAGACPAGHFCPAGTIMPIACSEHTINLVEGGSNYTACLECPPGKTRAVSQDSMSWSWDCLKIAFSGIDMSSQLCSSVS